MKTLAVILPRVPFPLDKGDKLRAFHQIRVLSKHFNIQLYCLNDTRLHPETHKVLSAFTKSIQIYNLTRIGILLNLIRAFFSGKPLQTGYFFNATAARAIRSEIKKSGPDFIYCQLIRTAPYVMGIPILKTIDYQDVFSKGVERRIGLSPWYMRWILRMEHHRLCRFEAEVFDAFDQKTIISETDRALIPHPDRSRIHVIPNGVDFDYFSPVDTPKSFDLVFTGNMQYPPNVISAIFLIDKILPLIRKAGREIRLLIAGANPAAALKSRGSSHVTISGWQDDIRTSYNASRIFIAPMQIGTGLQNKLLEAMAMKLPCITSPLANGALKAKPSAQILVCETAEEYASAVIHLLDNPNFAEILAKAGQEYVHERFNWKQVSSPLISIIQHSTLNTQHST